MESFIKQCEKNKCILEVKGKQIVWKPNQTIRNKYCSLVIPYINDMLSKCDPNLVDKYQDLLFQLLVKKRKQVLDQFIQCIIDIVQQTYLQIEKERNIQFPDLRGQFDDPMSIPEFESFYKLSLAMKLATFVIHSFDVDKYKINPNYVIDRLVNFFITKSAMKRVMHFIHNATKKSIYNRELMWKYLTETVGLTPDQHIQMVLNYFFKAMMTLYDAQQQPNVMSYLAGYVNQSLYYLFTDTYDRHVQFVNIAKLRFSKNYNLIKQQAVFYLFDMITNLIKKLFPSNLTENDILAKKYNIKPYDIAQKGIVTSPIAKYVTFPLISKTFDIQSNYFTEYRNLRFIEVYMSLVAENVLGLRYLAKLMRSIVIDRTQKKLKLNRIKVSKLEKISTVMKAVTYKKKFFTNIVQESKNYLYYDPILHDVFILDIDLFADDLYVVYDYLWNKPDELDTKLSKIKIWYNRPEVIKNTFAQLATLF